MSVDYREEFIAKRESQYSDDYVTNVAALYKFFGIINTGGVAVSLTVLSQAPNSFCLKCCITLFLAGTLACMFTGYREIDSVKKRIQNLVAKDREFNEALIEYKGAAFNKLHESDTALSKLSKLDYAVALAPGVTSALALIFGAFAVWQWSPNQNSGQITKVIITNTVPVTLGK